MSRRAKLFLVLGFTSLIGLMLFVALIVLATISRFGGGDYDEATLLGDGGRKVAVVNITGTIHGGSSEGGLFSDGGAGARDVIGQLRQAADDPTVVAVVLRIDSPGGAVVASDDIAVAVRRLREDKPVVASMGEVAASGGYYIASQAETIVANDATITGSIGVIAVLPNLEGTYEKLGIQPRVFKAGEFKDVGSPFRDMTEQERAMYQALLDEAHTQFIQRVAAGREMPEDTVRRLADGRIYSGQQAKVNGLVDDTGDLEAAYRKALTLSNTREGDSRLIEYRIPTGFGFPFGVSSPVDEVRRELGLGFGLQYLFVP